MKLELHLGGQAGHGAGQAKNQKDQVATCRDVMCLLGYSQWEFHFKLISCRMIKNDDMTVI